MITVHDWHDRRDIGREHHARLLKEAAVERRLRRAAHGDLAAATGPAPRAGHWRALLPGFIGRRAGAGLQS